MIIICFHKKVPFSVTGVEWRVAETVLDVLGPLAPCHLPLRKDYASTSRVSLKRPRFEVRHVAGKRLELKVKI
jgi:hypothetical protein